MSIFYFIFFFKSEQTTRKILSTPFTSQTDDIVSVISNNMLQATPPYILYPDQWQESEHIKIFSHKERTGCLQGAEERLWQCIDCQRIINKEWTPGYIFNPRKRSGSLRIMLSCRSSCLTAASTHNRTPVLPSSESGYLLMDR